MDRIYERLADLPSHDVGALHALARGLMARARAKQSLPSGIMPALSRLAGILERADRLGAPAFHETQRGSLIAALRGYAARVLAHEDPSDRTTGALVDELLAALAIPEAAAATELDRAVLRALRRAA